ncbi:MAG: cellulase family glycosylhydrolase, partial [Lachnospiraceae bacterium]|nr:cellulase family glycosylhydrolase [Lachnospiraceae bacterium]
MSEDRKEIETEEVKEEKEKKPLDKNKAALFGIIGILAIIVIIVIAAFAGRDSNKKDSSGDSAVKVADKGSESSSSESADSGKDSADSASDESSSADDNSSPVSDESSSADNESSSADDSSSSADDESSSADDESSSSADQGSDNKPAGGNDNQSGNDQSSQGGNDNQGGNDKPVGTAKITATATVANSWGDNPKYSQLEITVKNEGTAAVGSWKVEIEVGSGAKVDQGWGGTFSMSGSKLVVSNAEYNGNIPAGGSTRDVGVILMGVSGSLAGSGSGTPGGNNNNNNNNNQGGNQGGGTPAANPGALKVPAATTDDWLSVKGNQIVDSSGKKVWLTGVNWFGYNTGTNFFDGLWNADFNTSIQAIADHGFNLIRVPISAELILQWKAGKAPQANFNNATNSYLVGMDSLQIWDYVVGQARACGLKLMIDIHCAKTDAMGHNVNLWYTDAISTAQYQEALVWMAERYAKDDTIVAYDLKNEPHGKPYEGKNAAIWNNSTDANNWKYVAEQTALKVLAKNPNVLIMVEGTEIYPKDIKTNGNFSSTNDKDYYFNWWGGNLRGVKDYPINLGKYQNKLVYSPHDYGPTVYEQPWFKGGYSYDSLMKDCWKDNWFYIYETGTAPLLIGEWGGFMKEPNLTWMT